MCLMWSTYNPPDIVEGTAPFLDIEKAFQISLTDEEAFDMYNMTLDEAVSKILELKASQ